MRGEEGGRGGWRDRESKENRERVGGKQRRRERAVAKENARARATGREGEIHRERRTQTE